MTDQSSPDAMSEDDLQQEAEIRALIAVGLLDRPDIDCLLRLLNAERARNAALTSALSAARNQLVAWMLDSLTPEQAIKNVAHIDAALASSGSPESGEVTDGER